MDEENISQEFRPKSIDETRNYFIEEINQNALMNMKHKKLCSVLNYVEHLLILASAVTGCVSISAFASLGAFSIDIARSPVGLKIFTITTEIEEYKSIIKKHDKIINL